MNSFIALGEIHTREDVQKFKRLNLGEVGQCLNINANSCQVHVSPLVLTVEEANVAQKSTLLVALMSIAGAVIICLFAPTHMPILFTLSIVLFVYASYPIFGLWWARFVTLGRKYYKEYGPLSI